MKLTQNSKSVQFELLKFNLIDEVITNETNLFYKI